jgi:type IV pilus assembly protein PilV
MEEIKVPRPKKLGVNAVNRPIMFAKHARGFSMIEVLVTIVIIAIGLLGLAGVQARLQLSEMESYQRSQALMLLQDMANRIATNRRNAGDYVTGTASPLGTGDTTSCTTLTTTQQKDACEWSNALKGAAETFGSDSVGAMIGARGCIEDLGGSQYLITVTWQGLTPISAPAAACGQNLYNGAAGKACVNDLCRRAVTTIVRIGTMGESP